MAIRETFFNLIFGAETVIPIKIEIPLTRLKVYDEQEYLIGFKQVWIYLKKNKRKSSE